MGTSFVEYHTKGFWLSDSLLEVWLYLLARVIGDTLGPEPWLSELQRHWDEQSCGVGNGCVWAELDSFAPTDEHAADDLRRVGQFFLRLLRGELITDAATSRGIAFDEQAEGKGLWS
ncbi:MAG: hypothetical protein HGA45_28090, partial [Chloroflexales bacterium]|nr:hypothetical protein [Chloroflexales bacterium]